MSLRLFAALLAVAGCADEDRGADRSIDGGTLDAAYPDVTAPVSTDSTIAKRLCQAGVYTGNFDGEYRPAVFAFGGNVNFNVRFVAERDPPGVAFGLAPTPRPGVFTLTDGCFYADPLINGMYPTELVARLDGELDCNAGRLDGRLRGLWTILEIPGGVFTFAGLATAELDATQHALVSGSWKVKEDGLPAFENSYGGNGTWSADYADASTPPNRCTALIFDPDGGVRHGK